MAEWESVSVCAPQSWTEKLHSVSRLTFVCPTQPTMGMVRKGSAAAALVSWTNESMRPPWTRGSL